MSDLLSQAKKKCPFCAEDILLEAIKCRHCGEFLDGRHADKLPWYCSTSSIVLVLLTAGPLAIPLLWLRPDLKPLSKLLLSIAITAFSIWCYITFMVAYREMMEQFKSLGIDSLY